jgi:hypothetical protein
VCIDRDSGIIKMRFSYHDAFSNHDAFSKDLSSKLTSILHSSLARLRRKNERRKEVFDASKFIREWYTWGGGSYFFLFRNSLRTTNIQFSELLSLLRMYTFSRASQEGKAFYPFQFNSSKEFKKRLEDLWTDLGASSSGSQKDSLEVQKQKVNFFVTYYSELFLYTILVDCFYGSAVVHVPWPLSIRLDHICAESGYIHSCGRVIFVRKTDKARWEPLRKNLREYLTRYADSTPSQPKPVFFATFSHEQFSGLKKGKGNPRVGKAKDSADGLRYERDDAKVYLDKFFFGSDHIDDLLEKIEYTFRKEICVSGPRDFGKECKLFMEEYPAGHKDKMIWLLVEKSIASNQTEPSDKRYFVVYAQEYRNQNPFIIFDEMKPGWIAPVTLPHSLAAAMYNITKPYWPDTGTVTIADP